MPKKFICALLAAATLLSVLAVGPFQVKAESNMTISDLGEQMIKEFEGFNEQPKWDQKHHSVGWGCTIDTKRWAITDKTDPQYVDKLTDENGDYVMQINPATDEYDYVISEAGAQKLLDEHMASHCEALNSFADKYGLTFTQGQFDALVSFSYNIGGSWMRKTDWHIFKALTSGDTGAYLAYALTLYSTTGGVTTRGHLKRRLLELQMYLYDVYDTEKNWPEDLRYILFDGNGGDTEYNPHGFNVNYPVEDFWVTFTQTPTGTDASGNTFTYEFAGWYTEPVGGEQITVLDESLESGMILYAHWKNPVTGQIDDVRPGTAVDVKVKATSSTTMREGPATFFTGIRTVYKNELLHITRVTTGKDGNQWGLTEEGWVRISHTNYGTTAGDSGSSDSDVTEEGTWGTVDGTNVRIRTEAGVKDDSTIVKEVDDGYRVLITEIADDIYGKDRQWGKMSDGNWICMDYVVLDDASEEEPETPADPEAPDISDAITVEAIRIDDLPTVREYALCGSERIPDVTGGRIRITLSNGTKKWVDITRGMVSGFDNTKLGTNTITVTVGGASATYTVEIVPTDVASIEVQTLPNKGLYVQGVDQLDLTGCKLLINYNLGGTRVINVTADMVTGFDNTTAGTKTLTVTYEGFTATFEVQVVLATVEFKNYDGTVISSAKYEYGASVTVPENPVRPADEHGEYEFVGWDKEVTACSGNATYTAVFKLIYPMGDVDRNMLVNEDDAIYLLRHVVFPEKYPVEVVGDYDKDGDVDEDDAIYLLRHVVFPEKYPLS